MSIPSPHSRVPNILHEEPPMPAEMYGPMEPDSSVPHEGADPSLQSREIDDAPQLSEGTEPIRTEEPERPRRWPRLAKKAGAWSLLAAGLVVPQVQDMARDIASMPVTVAAAFNLPGSELTDTIPERTETKIRKELIERNEAHEVVTVQTGSGITLEVMQSGLGDNPERPLTVDQSALETSLNFIIHNLDKLDQDEVSQEKIKDFQQKASAGELDHATMTIIVSTDPDHCFTNDGRTFTEVYDTDDCTAVGKFHDGTGLGFEARSTINPTLLVTSTLPNIYVKRVEEPGRNTDGDIIASSKHELVPLIPQNKPDAMASTLTHELAHGVISILAPQMDDKVEHEQFVHPLTGAGNALMLGFIPDREPLPTPFSFPLASS